MQTSANNNDNEQESLEAPARLVAALQQTTKQDIFIPRTLDETILGEARSHLSRPQQRALNWLPLFRWSFASATALFVIVIASVVLRQHLKPAQENAVTSTPALNAGRPVDILDAFALARELKAGKHPDSRQDANGDGVVDQRDVAALAAQAVSLQKGGRS